MADDVELKEPRAWDSDKAAEGLAGMPLPQDLQLLLLIGIFGLLVLYTLYFTSEIVLPIVFAFILSLRLSRACAFSLVCMFPRPSPHCSSSPCSSAV
jgi:hypothetical protein